MQHKEHNGYARFREMLKHYSAKPVITSLQEFVRQFPTGLSRSEAARRVHKFLTTTQDWMLSDIVVFSADGDEEGRMNAAEGLEKFLLSRLHQKIFATDLADQEEDARLHERVASLSWVSFEHLGVPPVEPSLLMLAVNELRRVEDYKAPRDKLVCILNASRVINDVLKRTFEDAGVAGRPLSADDFLPLLIFTVISANPPRLHSNVEFVAAFRHPSRLVAEDAYFLTALQSAIAFLNEATAKVLEVSEDEFNRHCAASLATHREAQAQEGGHVGDMAVEAEPRRVSPTAGSTATLLPAAGEGGPAATVAAKAAELNVVYRQQLAEKVRALPISFEAVRAARELRMDEVPGLLEEYKEMARLLREVEGG